MTDGDRRPSLRLRIVEYFYGGGESISRRLFPRFPSSEKARVTIADNRIVIINLIFFLPYSRKTRTNFKTFEYNIYLQLCVIIDRF